MFRDFGKRLLFEVKNRAPQNAPVRITAPAERKFTVHLVEWVLLGGSWLTQSMQVWIGGAILASLSSFQNMWIR